MLLLRLSTLSMQYDITKERIIALIDADKSMLETLAEGVSLSHSQQQQQQQQWAASIVLPEQ